MNAFKPINVFFVVLGAVAIVFSLVWLSFRFHEVDADKRNRRVEACTTIEDPELRTLCVSGVH